MSGERTEYLFFPSLLEGVRSEVKWIISGDGVCALGWYLSCEGKFSFFPPWFVYVLLLKLAIEYSHPHGDDDDDESNDHTPQGRSVQSGRSGHANFQLLI